MCKPLGITIVTMVLTTFLYGQPIRWEEIRQELWKNQTKRFKIKSVTAINSEGRVKSVYYYNEYGDLSRVESDSAVGKAGVVSILVYDSARQLSEKRIINSKGQIYRFIIYTYNSKCQLIKKEWTDSDKHNEETWTYEYDQNGNKVKENQASSAFSEYSVTKFRYNKGKLMVSKTSNEFGKLKKLSYQYNRKGQVTKETLIEYSFNNFTSALIYSYNNAGDLATLMVKYNGKESSLTTYQYNEKGLLESETWKDLPEMKLSKTTYVVGY